MAKIFTKRSLETFYRSEAYAELKKYLESTIEKETNQLLSADPSDIAKITQHQTKANFAKRLMNTIEDEAQQTTE